MPPNGTPSDLDVAPGRATSIRYYVLAALCLITFINYVQRNSFGGLETTFRERLSIDKNDTADAISWFFWVYAFLQIPSGMLAQRIGPRLALAIYVVGWSVAAGMLGVAVGAIDLIAYRAIMGAFQAGIFPCATLIMAAWLPVTRRALASSLLNSSMLLGGAMVNTFTGFLLEPLGLRIVLIVYALPGLVFAAWFYWWFRNRPHDHSAVNEQELQIIGVHKEKPAGPQIPWQTLVLLVVFNMPLFLLCAQQFCRAGGNRYVDSWMSTYLQEVPLKDKIDEDLRTIALTDDDNWFSLAKKELERLKKISDRRKALANHLTSLPLYAGIFGGLAGGLISDWLMRRTGRRVVARNGVAVVSLAITVLVYLPIFFLRDAYSQMFFICIGFFFSAISSPCAYSLSMDIGGKHLPIVFGAMNMVGNFGAAAVSKMVPRVNEIGGGWTASLIMFVGIHAVSLVCWMLLNPNQTVGEKSVAASQA